MAVASVSVILTVVVLKLHHCSPNQKKVPGWVRHFVLGYLARIVRCSCVDMPCLKRKRRTSSFTVSDIESREISNKLLKELESITQQANGSRKNDRYKYKTSSRHETNSSKINLEIKDFNISENSSLAGNSDINFQEDNSADTMADILKYLKFLVVKSDAEDAETEVVDEWKQVALVVDRLFFWMFLIITVVSSVIILVIVPSFKYVEDEGL